MGVRKRLILSFSGFLILINLAFWAFYYLAKDRLENDLETKLVGVSQVLAQNVRGDALAALDPGDEVTRTYRNIRDNLEHARVAFELNRVLVVDTGGRLFIDSQGVVPIGDRVYVLESMTRELEAAVDGTPATTVVYRGDDGRPYKSAFAPVANISGEIVGVLVAEASAAFLRQIEFLRNVIVVIAIASVVALMALAAAISWSVLAPLLSLVRASHQIKEGRYDAGVEPSGASEIKILAASFNEMAASIREKESRLRDLAKQEARRAEDLEHYAQYILGSIANGIVSIDRDGIVRVCNAETCRILGVGKDGAEGKAYREIPSLEPVSGLLDRALERGEVVKDQYLEIVNAAGERFDVSVSAAPLTKTAETGVAVTLVITDQTRLIALQEKVKRSETLAAVGELAAHVAHEVRNPLGSMRLFMDLLARDEVDDEKRRLYSSKVSAEIERLEAIVTQFLEYSAPDKLSLSEFDLAELIGDAVAFAQNQSTTDAIHFGGNYRTTGPVIVNADRNQLMQLFLNLVINARDALKDSGDIDVNIGQSDDGNIVVTVRDTGVGIAPEDIDNVFKPFYSTKPDGSGLGLAMVQRVVDNHGGRADIESALGEGTAITIALPIAGGASKEEEEIDR
jgi:PAS domain S-box-containing protein